MSAAAIVRATALDDDVETPRELLSVAAAYVRPRLMRDGSAGDRLRILWAGVKAARDLGAVDVVEDEFLALARVAGLVIHDPARGQFGEETVRHVIRWAMLGMNPFQ